jgi:hypothetical protein
MQPGHKTHTYHVSAFVILGHDRRWVHCLDLACCHLFNCLRHADPGDKPCGVGFILLSEKNCQPVVGLVALWNRTPSNGGVLFHKLDRLVVRLFSIFLSSLAALTLSRASASASASASAPATTAAATAAASTAASTTAPSTGSLCHRLGQQGSIELKVKPLRSIPGSRKHRLLWSRWR